MTRWEQDILGPGWWATTVEQDDDREGPVVATVVRYTPDADAPRFPRAVLYLHGYSDYFFQPHLGEYFNAHQIAFYALDLRKYGRSLRDHQTPGYCDRLSDYDEDIEAGLAIIRDELGLNVRIVILGHSTGGLIAALWTDRHRGEVSGLILNSPWLETFGAATSRTIGGSILAPLTKINDHLPIGELALEYYGRTISEKITEDWDTNPVWKPHGGFPVRAGWLAAITAGHGEVDKGLDIDVPILVCLSARTLIGPRWSEQMRYADTVIDVDAVAHRAPELGRCVTIVRIVGGLHDLAMSTEPARTAYFDAITTWSVAYGWLEPPPVEDVPFALDEPGGE